MKKILLHFLLFALSLSAQDYHKQWEKVVALELKGQIKSAIKQTDKIYKDKIDLKINYT